MFVFSETRKRIPEELKSEIDPFSQGVQEWLLHYIPLWEASNAAHLIDTIDARIVSRETFKAAIWSKKSSRPAQLENSTPSSSPKPEEKRKSPLPQFFDKYLDQFADLIDELELELGEDGSTQALDTLINQLKVLRTDMATHKVGSLVF